MERNNRPAIKELRQKEEKFYQCIDRKLSTEELRGLKLNKPPGQNSDSDKESKYNLQNRKFKIQHRDGATNAKKQKNQQRLTKLQRNRQKSKKDNQTGWKDAKRKND